MKRAGAWLAAALWMAGCDGTVAIEDGGASDAAIADAAFADAGIIDAGIVEDAGADAAIDASTSVCEPDCGTGEACVRGVCVADCSGDVSGFDAALGEGLVPLANFCRPASAYAVHVEPGNRTVWDLTALTGGTVTTFVLSRWTLDPASAPSPEGVATAQHDTGSVGVTTFPSGYVALDEAGTRAVFGYTTSAADLAGGIFYVDMDGGVTEVPAPGNFDVAWVGENEFVVNGAGLGPLAEGQGLYAATPAGPAHVGANFGAYSGSVVAGPSYILTAGVAEDFSSRAHFLSRERFDEALAAGTPIDFRGELSLVLDPTGEPLGSTFSQLGDRLVITPFGGPLTSYAVTVADGEMTLSDSRVLATGGSFTDALDAGDGQLLLVHANGLLLVRD